jgi:hypothetical protein
VAGSSAHAGKEVKSGNAAANFFIAETEDGEDEGVNG